LHRFYLKATEERKKADLIFEWLFNVAEGGIAAAADASGGGGEGKDEEMEERRSSQILENIFNCFGCW
jgi:hypothetical protein